MKIDKAKGSLRVLSWNVNGIDGCKNEDVLNQILKIENIDIIFLSEFNFKKESNNNLYEALQVLGKNATTL